MKQLQVLLLGVTTLVIMCHISLFAMPGLSRADDDDEEAQTAAPPTPVAAQVSAPNNLAGVAVGAPTNKSADKIGSVESFSTEGPNTVDQDDAKIGTHGNWVKKKDFLMRSFDIQKEISALAAKIQGYQSVYQQKFNAIDQTLDIFYRKLGLEQGKVEELFSQLEEYIEQKRQRRIARFKRDITEVREQQMAIEQLEETLKTNKEELTQLKNDMKSIEDLDKSVSARVQRADEQIATAQREAIRSQSIVQSMWDMLDDKLAKAAYFELKDGILRRLQTIDSYLQQELLGDLEKVAGSINAQITKAQESAKGLEAKGFLINDRSKRLDELNLKKGKEAQQLLEQERQTQRRVKASESKGFFQKIYGGIVDFIVGIYRFFAGLFGYGEPVVKARVRQRPAAEQTPLQTVPAPGPVTQPVPQPATSQPAFGQQSLAGMPTRQ